MAFPACLLINCNTTQYNIMVFIIDNSSKQSCVDSIIQHIKHDISNNTYTNIQCKLQVMTKYDYPIDFNSIN